MKTKLKNFFKLFIFSVIIIFSNAIPTKAMAPPPPPINRATTPTENMPACECCEAYPTSKGKCRACADCTSCGKCKTHECLECKGNCNKSNFCSLACRQCLICVGDKCRPCMCCYTKFYNPNDSYTVLCNVCSSTYCNNCNDRLCHGCKCQGNCQMWNNYCDGPCNNCLRCDTCECEECFCTSCNAKVKRKGQRCATCNLCKGCKSCKTHVCSPCHGSCKKFCPKNCGQCLDCGNCVCKKCECFQCNTKISSNEDRCLECQNCIGCGKDKKHGCLTCHGKCESKDFHRGYESCNLCEKCGCFCPECDCCEQKMNAIYARFCVACDGEAWCRKHKQCYLHCPCIPCKGTRCLSKVENKGDYCSKCLSSKCHQCNKCTIHTCKQVKCICAPKCSSTIRHKKTFTCPSCIRGKCSKCKGCKKHDSCRCNNDDDDDDDDDDTKENPQESDPDDGGGDPGSDFDAWIDIKIYDADENFIHWDNEIVPGAFIMQYFEGNDTIENNKLIKLSFDGDIYWEDETNERIKIERLNDKIKLWKADRRYIAGNDEWVTIEKRHEDIFGNSNSKTFSAEDFYNDIQYKQFWVEGVSPGVSGIKTFSDNHFDDEVKITVCGGTDLTIHNGGSDLDNGESSGTQGPAVSDSDEESVGAYLLVNWDDDDADGTLTTENGWEYDPVPDLQENYVANEDNLAKLVLNISALPLKGNYELEVVNGADKIKFWEKSTKSLGINLSGNSISWDLTKEYDRRDLQSIIDNGVWIEGIKASDFERDIEIVFRYYDDNGAEKSSDTIKATVVMLNLGAGVCRAMAIPTLKLRGHAGLLTKFNGICKPTDFINSSLYTVHEMQSSDDCCVTPTWKTFHDQATYWDEYGYDLTYIQRLKILQTAKWVENKGSGDEKIKYTMSKVLKPEVWSGSLATLKNLRCDGLVEFCYEWNEINLFGKKPMALTNPHYSIIAHIEEHNEGTMNLYFFWQPHLYPATQCGHENTYRGNKWETMFNSIEISNPDFGNIIW